MHSREEALRIIKKGNEDHFVNQGEVAISSGILTTGGLATCVAIGIESEEKNLLAHVDASTSAGSLRYWIDQEFGAELINSNRCSVKVWNYSPEMGTSWNGQASQIVKKALQWAGFDLELLTIESTVEDMFSTVGVGQRDA